MHDLFPEATNDDDFMFAALPYSYATMNMMQLVENSQSFISADLRRDLIDTLGEF